MIQLCDKSDCTGCEACKSICPKNAITMVPEGNLLAEIPIIDTNLCIECHACERVCPVLHPLQLSDVNTAYAAIAKNAETNKTATSGGIATEISRKILNSGGVVYGAVCENGIIHHKRCSSLDDLDLLKGSKYTKSYIENSYVDARADLMNNIEVAFFGTPCQIAGLKSFLRKDYDNLITIDLICHGTPSQTLLDRHILDITKCQNITDIKKIVFREDNFHFRLYDKSGIRIYDNNPWKDPFKDAYYTAFIIGECSFRDSCYKCRYATPHRVSDLTIGDFWGLDNNVKFSRKPTGVSVVLPITQKGKRMLNSIEESLEIHERPAQEAINGNAQLRNHSNLSILGKTFRKLVSKGFSLKCALNLAYLPILPLYKLKAMLKK